jgi:hypothetical protein
LIRHSAYPISDPDRRLTVVSVARYTARSITVRRGRARRMWRSVRAKARRHDVLVAPTLPDYFVDRYAMQLHPAVVCPRRPLSLPSTAGSDRCGFLASVVRPARRLDGWTPEPRGPTGVGDFYATLVDAWAAFCNSEGLPNGLANLPDASGARWADVLNDTVHYPGPPVFMGATYVDALDAAAASDCLALVGTQGAIDFYCFMLQVHEGIHRYQIGEPLLNEVVTACIWSHFLDLSGLMGFQADKSRSLIREARVVERRDWLFDAAIRSELDAACAIDSHLGGTSYFDCCALAFNFDRGRLSYRGYLDSLDELLGGGLEVDLAPTLV